jgi:hippurate hydrolase
MPVITMKGSSTPLVNDDALAERMAAALKPVLGEKSVLTDLPPTTGSEDVHLLKGPHTDVPFNFLFVGIVDPKVFAAAQRPGEPLRPPYAGHNPNFVVDLAAIPVGTEIATIAMLELLRPTAP